MTKAKLTILGCGNSSGVPAAGNYWGHCDPEEPKNTRMRCSALIESDNTTLIIDTGPDFRHQVNRAQVERLDAVLYTHHHGDHVNGLDDLRSFIFRQNAKMPVYGSTETLKYMKHSFYYAFEGGKIDLYPRLFDVTELEDKMMGKPFQIGDITITPFLMDHGTCYATGYRIGDTAYCVDMWRLDDEAFKALKGVKNWIVDCAAYNNDKSKVHAHLAYIERCNEEIGAENVILTSLSLFMDYSNLKEELKTGFYPAYDGFLVDIR